MTHDGNREEEAFQESGRKLFAGPVEFRHAAETVAALPVESVPEIAFAGRSNVGKSSLVNALTGRNALARISRTPGRTRQLNFFDVNGRLTLVDMPGYGFAAAPKQQVSAWTSLIRAYLGGRATLARVYLLIDARHGFKPVDEEILTLMDRAAVSYQVILTKTDALDRSALSAVLARTERFIAKRPAAFPRVIPTSARSGAGIADLRGSIARLLAERSVPL
ncbi:MAG: ribosome biogenesis GTP-binding protein YihA/YsxC [Methylobacteriaceae bacterium]|jgi:GTP-binding protein|nr:ribosome biogenesis GTP-binding protein YihA/YsxC [Methylobacteriaceae bacterium]